MSDSHAFKRAPRGCFLLKKRKFGFLGARMCNNHKIAWKNTTIITDPRYHQRRINIIYIYIYIYIYVILISPTPHWIAMTVVYSAWCFTGSLRSFEPRLKVWRSAYSHFRYLLLLDTFFDSQFRKGLWEFPKSPFSDRECCIPRGNRDSAIWNQLPNVAKWHLV